jgi:uncharacterized membrane protein
MLNAPPIPPFDALHPLVVHFPIALLLVAPLLVILGLLLRPEKGRSFLFAALVLMVLGTAGSYLAVASGEAAAQLAERGGGVDALLENHEEMAETVRMVFTVLSLVFAAILVVPHWLRRPLTRTLATSLMVVFLAFYGAGALLLANTAHAGGRLVHEHGVTALLPASPPPAAASLGFDDDDD